MKKQFLRALFTLGIFFTLTAISARAQGGDNFTVRIPFNFNVAGKTLPAGQYIVRRNTTNPVGLEVQRKDGRAGVFVLTTEIRAVERQETSKLVFNRYGDQYFLAQVWTSGRVSGHGLQKSRKERLAEREMAKSAASPQKVAVVGSQP